MKNTIIFLIFFFTSQLNGQVFTELPSMPEPVANNAVTGAIVNDIPHVYSFSGIDSTKLYSGIHQKAFRYNTQSQIWDEIPPLPSGNGRIAAGASTVKNKIYIIGGYEVFSNGGEISVDKTHIYNPETNSYEPDGAPIPIAIDDQVQAVWRDSLIYVVTGWSNNTNVPNVQIYNPSNDTWLEGTNVPNNTLYKAFGASGEIIGDTIFYSGGARVSANFPITPNFRKGIINPDDPTDITWSFEAEPGAKTYRSAAFKMGDNAIAWIGGSEVTYNFDGIAYNGTGGVEPRESWSIYGDDFGNGILKIFIPDSFGNKMPKVMDLRGVASNGNGQAIIAGGMLENQKVTNKVFLINFDMALSSKKLSLHSINISPNPAIDFFTIEKEGQLKIEIWNVAGQLIFEKNYNGFEPINISNINTGVYFVKVFENGEWIGIEKLVVR